MMRLKIKILPLLVIAAMLFVMTACSQEPAEIHYASDECTHCKMMITDKQFASQVVTDKGKAYKFDAIECMAAYYQNNSGELENAMLYVSNYDKPGEWINARRAQFVKSEVVNSPMGESMLAFPSSKEAKEHTSERPGALLQWDEVSQIEM